MITLDAIERFKIELDQQGEDSVREKLRKDNYHNPFDHIAKRWLDELEKQKEEEKREKRIKKSARTANIAAWISAVCASFTIIYAVLSNYVLLW